VSFYSRLYIFKDLYIYPFLLTAERNNRWNNE